MKPQVEHHNPRTTAAGIAIAGGGVLLSLIASAVLSVPAQAGHLMWIPDDDSTSAPIPAAARSQTNPGMDAARSGTLPTSLSWAPDPSLNTVVNNTPNDQLFAMAISDGAGGMIVTWQDARNFDVSIDDIYAQHILKCGSIDPTWPPTGVAVTQATTDDTWPIMVSDGSGGAFVTWSNGADIFAQHLLGSGVVDPLWPANGRAVCTAPGRQLLPKLTSDGAHGAYIAWDDRRPPIARVFAHHLLSSGVDPTWTVDGTALFPGSPRGQTFPVICSDGAGGAIVAWNDLRDSGLGRRDIFAQRLTATGALLWPAGGQPCCRAPGLRALNGASGVSTFITSSADGQANAIVPDGAGGMIVTWTDDRDLSTTDTDIYAQRLTASGAVAAGWLPDGVPLCRAGGPQNAPLILADGAGGAIASWNETDPLLGTFGRPGAFAQHVTASGVVDGPADGLLVSTAGGTFIDFVPDLVSDASGGAVLAWSDARNFATSGFDMFAQRVRTAPSFSVDPGWVADGTPLSVAAGDQFLDVPGGGASDGAGGMLIAWDDGRDLFGSSFDIYAQAVRKNGALPPVPPVISAAGADGWIECPGTPVFTPPTAMDEFGQPAVVNLVSDQTATNYCGGSFSETRTWQAVDGCGNLSALVSQTITVRDNLPPVLSAAGADATIACPATPVFTPPTSTDSCSPSGVALFTDVTTPGACPGSYSETKTWRAQDACGNLSGPVSQTITVVDTTPPLISAAGADAAIESPAIPVFTPPTASDACNSGPVVNQTGDVITPGPCAGTYSEKRTWKAVDACGNTSAPVSQTISVVNSTVPVATITAPASGTVIPLASPIAFAGSFTDNSGDTHTAQWAFDAQPPVPGVVDDGARTVSALTSFSVAGVYTVKLTVTDQCGAAGVATQVDGVDAMVVVYDPRAGFVTGGGWINSPPGAYAGNPALSGKANFGFVSKYVKGKTIPIGETEFQFKAADFDFHSAVFEWLVISGARAQYKGSGTINGAGDYGFMLTAIDGQLNGGGGTDRFRIKIVNKSTNAVVYDNQMGMPDSGDPTTVLGGGSIVIHQAGAGNMPAAAPGDVALVSPPLEFALSQNEPNPFRLSSEIHYSLPGRSRVSIGLYDLAGRRRASLVDAEVDAGIHSVTLTRSDDGGNSLVGGVYFLRMTASALEGGARYTSTRKVLMVR